MAALITAKKQGFFGLLKMLSLQIKIQQATFGTSAATYDLMEPHFVNVFISMVFLADTNGKPPFYPLDVAQAFYFCSSHLFQSRPLLEK